MRRSQILGVLFCFITLPGYSQGLLDDYDPRATQGISMRCWIDPVSEWWVFRLTSNEIYIDDVPQGIDERDGNVVANKIDSGLFETVQYYDFNEKIIVAVEKLKEGVTLQQVYGALQVAGNTHLFDEIKAKLGEKQISECM